MSGLPSSYMGENGDSNHEKGQRYCLFKGRAAGRSIYVQERLSWRRKSFPENIAVLMCKVQSCLICCWTKVGWNVVCGGCGMLPVQYRLLVGEQERNNWACRGWAIPRVDPRILCIVGSNPDVFWHREGASLQVRSHMYVRALHKVCVQSTPLAALVALRRTADRGHGCEFVCCTPTVQLIVDRLWLNLQMLRVFARIDVVAPRYTIKLENLSS